MRAAAAARPRCAAPARQVAARRQAARAADSVSRAAQDLRSSMCVRQRVSLQRGVEGTRVWKSNGVQDGLLPSPTRVQRVRARTGGADVCLEARSTKPYGGAPPAARARAAVATPAARVHYMCAEPHAWRPRGVKSLSRAAAWGKRERFGLGLLTPARATHAPC